MADKNDTTLPQPSKQLTPTEITRAEVELGAALRGANDVHDKHVVRAREVQRELETLVRAVQDPDRFTQRWQLSREDVVAHAREEIDRIYRRASGWRDLDRQWRLSLMKYVDALAHGVDALAAVDRLRELDAKKLARVVGMWLDQRPGGKKDGGKSKWRLLEELGKTVGSKAKARAWKRTWDERDAHDRSA